MNPSNCPICFEPLETIEVAPCWDCGHGSTELQHLAQGMHRYAEFKAFGALRIVLCDFCDADFGSYYAAYFGMRQKGLVGRVLEFQRDVRPEGEPRKDKFCPQCKQRLAFLEFLREAIELNESRA